MKHILVAVALVMVCLTPGVSRATSIIFSDNFNTEIHGYNYTGFANWTVVPGSGTVDLIGGPPPSAFFDFIPGNGNYVDMDGSTNHAGIMLSTPLALIANQPYLLTFDLAGDHRSDIHINTLTYGIDLNGVVNTLDHVGTQTLGSGAPFSLVSLSFTPSSNYANARIQFGQNGGDNIGLLLDNVKLQTVPEPASLMLLGAGLAGIGIWRRKAAKIG